VPNQRSKLPVVTLQLAVADLPNRLGEGLRRCVAPELGLDQERDETQRARIRSANELLEAALDLSARHLRCVSHEPLSGGGEGGALRAPLEALPEQQAQRARRGA